MKRQHKHNKLIGVLGVIVTVVFFIWFGFGETNGKIIQCHATMTKWVEAKYSEFRVKTCTDADGDLEVCSGWEHWIEEASPRYSAVTVNGELVSGQSIGKNVNGLHIPHDPPINAHFSSKAHFNGFEDRATSSFTVTVVTEDGKKDKFTTRPHKYKSCLSRLNQSTLIKTWYGSPRNSDFE